MFNRRVRSSTWPTVDSTAGRTASLISRKLVDVSWSEASNCRSRGPTESTVWRDLGDHVADVVALDRPQPDLLDDRVEERGLHPR